MIELYLMMCRPVVKQTFVFPEVRASKIAGRKIIYKSQALHYRRKQYQIHGVTGYTSQTISALLYALIQRLKLEIGQYGKSRFGPVQSFWVDQSSHDPSGLIAVQSECSNHCVSRVRESRCSPSYKIGCGQARIDYPARFSDESRRYGRHRLNVSGRLITFTTKRR